MMFRDNVAEDCVCCKMEMCCDAGGYCHQCSVDCTDDKPCTVVAAEQASIKRFEDREADISRRYMAAIENGEA